MKHVYDKNGAFKYTPEKATDANYLREKFRKIRAEQEKARAETQQKVSTIKPRVKGRAP